MAMMDEKGKVMGKINIIDLIVIFVVLAVGIVIGSKLLGNDTAVVSASRNISYVVEVEDVDGDVYESLMAMTLPDQLFAGTALVNGYVVSMSGEPNTDKIYEIEDTSDTENPVLVEKYADLYDMTFVIEASLADIANEVGTQEVRVGKEHIVKTSNFELTGGLIVSIEEI